MLPGRVCLPPFFCCDAEQCYIQDISLAGIGKALPLWSDVRRDQHVFDSIGMDTVIDFCQCPVEIPAKGKPAVFIRL